MWKKIFKSERPATAAGNMPYVNLGRAGLKVSRLCLGTMSFGTREWQPWTISEKESRDIVWRALELGINFFDTADVYSAGASEQILGKALRDFVPRDQVIVATKVHGPMGPGPNDRGLSRKHIFDAVDASLRRLQTDYIDLYQIHRWDYRTPIEETLEALDDIVRSGKVRYCGASSMFAWQFSASLHIADHNGWARFVSMQNHYNLVYREEEREMIPLCGHEGVAVLPWSPLARGLLAGKWRGRIETTRSRTDEYSMRLYTQAGDLAIADRVSELAARRGVQAAQIALAWLMCRPGITAPVLGATRPEHVDDAAAALTLQLDVGEIQLLEELYQPHPVLGHEGPEVNS
ncbi:MAG TPA: aldo/keto reductase [Bryobacteraceae bacterium]|jgi:aryl-alcohol dehydrogenase (NADP+)|nr:aldo/keto reductase [Bryobacteraceae bacterium]